MPLCILIPHNVTTPIACTILTDLVDHMSVIDGYLISIPIHQPGLVLLTDEDAVSKRRPLNRRASVLWWLHQRAAGTQQSVAGDVLILGQTDAGKIIDLPDSFRHLLMDSDRYVVEARAKRFGEAWARSTIEFSDYFEAAAVALQALSHWDDVRVIPVTECELTAQCPRPHPRPRPRRRWEERPSVQTVA